MRDSDSEPADRIRFGVTGFVQFVERDLSGRGLDHSLTFVILKLNLPASSTT